MGKLRGKQFRSGQLKVCLNCGKPFEPKRGYAIHLAKTASCRSRTRETFSIPSTPHSIAQDDTESTDSETDSDDDCTDDEETGMDGMLVDGEEMGYPDVDEDMPQLSPDVDSSDEADQRPHIPPVTQESGTTRSVYREAGADYGLGKSFFQVLEERDPPDWTANRDENPYWPFADGKEMELASWMVKAGLSNSQVTGLLKLSVVCRHCN
jgi:hypothetical protein